MLWYDRPATQWLEAQPIGNGRLGAMVFGGTDQETLQLNEGTVWAGGPHDYDNPEALAALPEIRRLVFAGEWEEAENLVNAHFIGRPGGQAPYQTVGRSRWISGRGSRHRLPPPIGSGHSDRHDSYMAGGRPLYP